MKTSLPKALTILLLVLSAGLSVLTNTGLLSIGKPYIYQASADRTTSEPVIVIENASVIPMDEERVLAEQTVIIRDGLIEQVGDGDQIESPDGAVVIDGRGKYLLPGLVDMHVHIQYQNDMLLLVANGVTSVRNMWGSTDKLLWVGLPDQLALGREIQAGRLLGPTIYNAGPVMEGVPSFHPLVTSIASPEQAAASVAWQVQQGYDFIKVYDHLSPEVYATIVETAAQYGVPVVGHVPFAVGVDGVLAGGQQTIEHLNGYIDSDTAEFVVPVDQLDEYAAKTREAGVWNVVTLTVYPGTMVDAEEFQVLQDQVGMKYQSPFVRMISPFLYKMAADAHTYTGTDYAGRITSLNRQMVAALHAAGAGILLGTDAAQPYHIPGFSVHEELGMLVEAGLSPYEALEAGTRNAAMVLGGEMEFGTIETGKRADMILLACNPLEEISCMEKRAGVMLRGRWLPEAALQAMLVSLAKSYQPSLLERITPLFLLIGAIYLLRMVFSKSREAQP